jgi:hypothetical protein
VQLEQVDAVQAEPPQAHLGLLAQVLGPPDRGTRSGPGGQDRLGGDQHVFGVRVDRLADDLLTDMGAVRVGGVDQLHAEFDGTTDDHAYEVLAALRVPRAHLNFAEIAGGPLHHASERQTAEEAGISRTTLRAVCETVLKPRGWLRRLRSARAERAPPGTSTTAAATGTASRRRCPAPGPLSSPRPGT